MPIIAALVLAAFVGGGVSVTAQSALPGDALYPIKIDVNEQVEGMLSFSDTAKANQDISAAQARLDEAQALAAEGKLDANTSAQLMQNFDVHAQDATSLIASLEAKGDTTDAASVAAHFQSTLAEESADFAKAEVSTQDKGNLDSIQTISASIQSALGMASSLSTNASAKAATSEGANGDESSGGSASANTSVHASNGLMIRAGSGATSSTDNGSVEGGASGGVHVNIY